jgi:hypothetical protein
MSLIRHPTGKHHRTHELLLRAHRFGAYKTPQAGTYAAEYSFVGFDDISDSYWASDFIWFLSARIIVNGRSNDLYVPEGNVTRAEFITILTRMTPGIDPFSTPSAGFLDVSPDDWYAKYIDWGVENGIVYGYGNGCFGPDDRSRASRCPV